MKLKKSNPHHMRNISQSNQIISSAGHLNWKLYSYHSHPADNSLHGEDRNVSDSHICLILYLGYRFLFWLAGNLGHTAV